MTSTVVTRPNTLFVSNGFGIQPRVFKRGSGVLAVENVAVFRTGTFRDSMGTQNTWERLHLDQVVANFNHLMGKGIFTPPVRDGHASFLINGIPGSGAVVGWHTSLSVETMTSPVDGQEYDYLLAGYDITEPYAQEKLQNGTWRNRSAEMIGYLTNDEAEFWPVYGGFAFVDIPAVEGLNFSHPAGSKLYVMLDKEIPVTTPIPGAPALNRPLPGQHGQPAGGQPTPPSPPTPQSAPPVPPTPAPAPAPQGGEQQYGQNGGAFVFTMNGQPTTDVSAVQRHILALEGFATESRRAARAAFVNALAQNNLILASAVPQYESLVYSMNDEQWALWQGTWTAAQQPALLAQHAAPASNAGGVAQPGQLTDDLKVAQEIVNMHRLNNMPAEQLKATGSYQKLVAAGLAQA